MVEASEVQLPTAREVEALDRLDEAHDDIREALDWATEQGDGAFAVRMTGALAEFWRTRRPPHGGPAAARLGARAGARRPGPVPAQGAGRRGAPRLVPGRLRARRGLPPRGAGGVAPGRRRGGRGDHPQLAGHQRVRSRRPRCGRGLRLGEPRAAAPDRRPGRHREHPQRARRRLPLPGRAGPGARGVRREPRAQAGARQRELAGGLADQPRARGARRRPARDGRRRLRGGRRDLGAHRRPPARGRRAAQRRPARPRPPPPGRRPRLPRPGLRDRPRARRPDGDGLRPRRSRTGQVERGALDDAAADLAPRCRGRSASGRGSSSRSGSRRPARSPPRAATTCSRSGCGPPRPASDRTAASRTCRPTSGTSTSAWPRSASASTRGPSPRHGAMAATSGSSRRRRTCWRSSADGRAVTDPSLMRRGGVIAGRAPRIPCRTTSRQGRNHAHAPNPARPPRWRHDPGRDSWCSRHRASPPRRPPPPATPLPEIKLGCALVVPNPLAPIYPNRAVVCRWEPPTGVDIRKFRLWKAVDGGDATPPRA